MTESPAISPSATSHGQSSGLSYAAWSALLLFVSFGLLAYADPASETIRRITDEVLVRYVPAEGLKGFRLMAGLVAGNPSPVMTLAGLFLVAVIIPASCTLLASILGHLTLLVSGGTERGWRGSSRSLWIHRFWVESLSVLLLAIACFAPMPLAWRLGLLVVGMPFVRLAAMSCLCVHLSRTQGLGVLRAALLVAPACVLAATLSMLFSLLPAIWASLWCLAHYL